MPHSNDSAARVTGDEQFTFKALRQPDWAMSPRVWFKRESDPMIREKLQTGYQWRRWGKTLRKTLLGRTD